jgi:hypothetical protein
MTGIQSKILSEITKEIESAHSAVVSSLEAEIASLRRAATGVGDY